MVQVVDSRGGTGTAAQLAGHHRRRQDRDRADDASGAAPHAWFVAFAPAEAPQYAVAVIVEHGGSEQSEATGGHVAAPIAARHAAVPAVDPDTVTTDASARRSYPDRRRPTGSVTAPHG